MNFSVLLSVDVMESCIFARFCSFTLHMSCIGLHFVCQVTSYDEHQLDFKRCGRCAVVKLGGVFGDHFNEISRW